MENVLFLSLNLISYDSRFDLDSIVKRDVQDWIDTLTRYSIVGRDIEDWINTVVSYRPDDPRELEKLQSAALLRRLYWLAGGTAHHPHDEDGLWLEHFTVEHNAKLCGQAIGVSCKGRFGEPDPENIHRALRMSPVYSSKNPPKISSLLAWRQRILEHIPAGFPTGHLVRKSEASIDRKLINEKALPPQLLIKLSVSLVKKIDDELWVDQIRKLE